MLQISQSLLWSSSCDSQTCSSSSDYQRSSWTRRTASPGAEPWTPGPPASLLSPWSWSGWSSSLRSAHQPAETLIIEELRHKIFFVQTQIYTGRLVKKLFYSWRYQLKEHVTYLFLCPLHDGSPKQLVNYGLMSHIICCLCVFNVKFHRTLLLWSLKATFFSLTQSVHVL